MVRTVQTATTGRRPLLLAGAAIGGLQVASPFIIKARGETPVKIGFIDPITGSLSALAVSEVEGAKWTDEQMNKSGGILGRPVELLVEDSANDTGTGVQKAHKLIERDKVDIIMGDVNSGIAYAIMGVSLALIRRLGGSPLVIEAFTTPGSAPIRDSSDPQKFLIFARSG